MRDLYFEFKPCYYVYLPQHLVFLANLSGTFVYNYGLVFKNVRYLEGSKILPLFLGL